MYLHVIDSSRSTLGNIPCGVPFFKTQLGLSEKVSVSYSYIQVHNMYMLMCALNVHAIWHVMYWHMWWPCYGPFSWCICEHMHTQSHKTRFKV